MYPKVDNVKRIFAFVIDVIIANLCSLIPFIGGIIGFLYMLLRDGLMDGQSVGKKLLGLKTMTPHGPATYSESARRNIIFAIPSLFQIIPFIGWIISGILAIIIWAVEIYKIINDPFGKRYGDIWADTQVVDEKSMSQT